MVRRLPFLILAACGVLALAACGGTKKAQVAVSSVFTRAPVATCLESHGFSTSTSEKDMNFIAFTATGGGLRAWKPKVHRKSDLILAFGADGDDAAQTIKAIRRFAKKSKVFRYRLRNANVVILWAYRPTKADTTVLRDCLRASIGKPPSS
jgi:hypothetical protein